MRPNPPLERTIPSANSGDTLLEFREDGGRGQACLIDIKR